MKNLIWTLKDLPELKVLDNVAFKAEGTLQETACKLIGAKTFHWGMVGQRQVNDEISVGDYSIHDSIGKGTAGHLLSEYQYRHMRVYRPRMPPGLQDSLAERGMKRYHYYGDQEYDKYGVVMVGVWWVLNKAGYKIEWFVHNSHKFWCLELNNCVIKDLWLPLVPDSEPPYPPYMEKSDKLELIWGTF